MTALAILLPIGSILPWKRAQLGRTLRLVVPALLALLFIH